MWIHLPALSALVYLVLIVFVVARESSSDGNRLLLFVLITSFFWPALYYAEMVADSLPVMIGITKVRFSLLLLVPLSLFMLLLHVVGKTKQFPRWGWLVLGVIPVLLAALSLTSSWHRLFRYDYAIEERYGMAFLNATNGPAYLGYVLYLYTVTGLNVMLLLRWFRETTYWGRRQAVLLMTSSLIPLLFDMGRLVGVEPIPGFNLAPATLGLSGSLIVWAVIGYRLAQASPVARAVLLDNLPSIVVVLDEMNRIVDVNRRTYEVLGCTREQLTWMLPESLDRPWKNWLRPDWVPDSTDRQDWAVTLGGETRYFERSVHCLRRDGRLIGHLIYLDDVTAFRKASYALAEQERLKEQASLLKDLHDGVGGISANISLLAQLAMGEENTEARQVSLQGILGLSQEMGVEVRRFISVLEQPDYGWSDWMLEVRTFCQTALDGLPIQLHLQIDLNESGQPLRADIGLSVYRLIKECVTNVVKHSGAHDVWVTVELRVDHLFIEVRDNGCGFQGDPERTGGLQNMRERVRRMGGEMETTSTGGVSQRVSIPVHCLWRPVAEATVEGKW